MGEYFSKTYVGKKARNYKGIRKETNCKQCKKKIKYYESMNPSATYCSRKCKAESQKKRIKKTCSNCQREISLIPSRIKWATIRGQGKTFH
jgi:hypothetical protein